MELAIRQRVFLLHHDVRKLMRSILLHSTVSILVASPPNYHVRLLPKEGRAVLVIETWLLLLLVLHIMLLLVHHESHLIILPEVTFDFWRLV